MTSARERQGGPTPQIGWGLGLAAQLVAGLLVTTGLLGTAELVSAYLVGPAPPSAWGDKLAIVENDAVSETLQGLAFNPVPLVKDVDLLWRNQPRAVRRQPILPRSLGRADTWTIENNSEGFRGPERVRRGDDVYRILCVGDSVTFGFNVDGEATFARRLERLLRDRYPARRIEVINAGVPGWSWVQGLRFIEHEGLSLRPDLVVSAHGTNDQFFTARITDSERIRYLGTPFARRVEQTALLLARTHVYRAVERAFGPAPAPTELSPGCRKQLQESRFCRRVSINEIEASAREVRRLTAAAGVDLLVLNLDFLETPAVRGVQAAVQKDSIPFVDFVAMFRQLRRADEDERARALGLAASGSPAGGTPPATGQRQLLFRVRTSTPARAVALKWRPSWKGDFLAEEPMYDDGTHGDEVAGDAVWSTRIEMPTVIMGLQYSYFQDGTPEFEPSTAIPRSIFPLPGDAVLPVEVLAEQHLMAERVHPNAAGHETIATEIVTRLPSFTSFERWSEEPRTD